MLPASVAVAGRNHKTLDLRLIGEDVVGAKGSLSGGAGQKTYSVTLSARLELSLF